MPTKTLLIQSTPIPSRVIDRDLAVCRNALRDNNDTLHSQPRERLELCVWETGMIDEARVVSLATLPDLVFERRIDAAAHDIFVLQTFCYGADEFANDGAAVKGLRGVNLC